MGNNLVLSEEFKEFIRKKIYALGFENYQSFLVSLPRVNGNPSFNISLDGTYSESLDHRNSLVCFCYNSEKTICFVEDMIDRTLTTSNPPDETHNSNWNKFTNKSTISEYKFFIINSCLLESGKYGVTNKNTDEIIIENQGETILIKYRTQLNEFAGYFELEKVLLINKRF